MTLNCIWWWGFSFTHASYPFPLETSGSFFKFGSFLFIYLFIFLNSIFYLFIRSLHMATLVEGKTKAPFSITTTPRVVLRSVGTAPFPGLLHFILDPYLIMLSVKQWGIKYHFLNLWYDSTNLGLNPPRSPELSTHSAFKFINTALAILLYRMYFCFVVMLIFFLFVSSTLALTDEGIPCGEWLTVTRAGQRYLCKRVRIPVVLLRSLSD